MPLKWVNVVSKYLLLKLNIWLRRRIFNVVNMMYLHLIYFRKSNFYQIHIPGAALTLKSWDQVPTSVARREYCDLNYWKAAFDALPGTVTEWMINDTDFHKFWLLSHAFSYNSDVEVKLYDQTWQQLRGAFPTSVYHIGDCGLPISEMSLFFLFLVDVSSWFPSMSLSKDENHD